MSDTDKKQPEQPSHTGEGVCTFCGERRFVAKQRPGVWSCAECYFAPGRCGGLDIVELREYEKVNR